MEGVKIINQSLIDDLLKANEKLTLENKMLKQALAHEDIKIKYQHKLTIVEAIQFINKESFKKMKYQWGNYFHFTMSISCTNSDSFYLNMYYPNGQIINSGDWIIKGIDGEFYPCPDSIFKQIYEKIK